MVVSCKWAILLGLSAALLAAPISAHPDHHDEGGPALAPTRVLSETDAERLRTVQGVTLQWIDWDERGDVEITRSEEGHWWLKGGQQGENGAGLSLDGFIIEIGEDYFLFDGRIAIMNTPDAGRSCEQHKIWRFEATQRRSYYRLREFEWCDYLTDYVDIYFAPGLR